MKDACRSRVADDGSLLAFSNHRHGSADWDRLSPCPVTMCPARFVERQKPTLLPLIASNIDLRHSKVDRGDVIRRPERPFEPKKSLFTAGEGWPLMDALIVGVNDHQGTGWAGVPEQG